MKKRIISLFAALLLVISALVISSCGGDLKNMKLSGEVPPVQKDFSKAERLILPEGAKFSTWNFGGIISYTWGSGDEIILTNDAEKPEDRRFGIYNIKTKKSTAIEYIKSPYISHGYAILSKAVGKKENGDDIIKYGVVNREYKTVFPFEYESGEINFKDTYPVKCLEVKGELYEIEDNGLLRRFKNNFTKLDDIYTTYKSDKYIFGFSQKNDMVYALNLSGKLIKAFENKSGSEYFQKVFLMGGDNVLTQSFTMLPVDYTGEDYDVFNSGYKWKLKTEIYNLKTGKTKTVDFDYFIKDCQSQNSNPNSWTIYNKTMGTKSILTLERIVDKVFREIGEDTFAAVANKKLKLTAMAPRNANKIQKISDNRFFVSGGNEFNFIMDKKCNIIEQFDAKQYIEYTSNGLAVMYKAKSGLIHLSPDKYGIIDKNGKTIVPFEYDLISDFYGDYAIGSKSSKYYKIDRLGNAEFIDSDINVHRGFYYISEYSADFDKHIYMFYNYAGTKLLECYNLSLLSNRDGFSFVRDTNQNDEYEFYIIN